MKKPALNLISGSLGAGKTTLIQQLIAQKPGKEQWALVVNEFGAVGVDSVLLGQDESIRTYSLPGGCICCTALTDLENTLQTIVEDLKPDRVLIEPTGLAEPDALLDIVQSSSLKTAFEIQSIISVFDLSTVQLEELQNMLIYQSLLNMADVLILNKADLLGEKQVAEVIDYCHQLFPPKQQVLVTQQGRVDLSVLLHRHFQPTVYRFSLESAETSIKTLSHERISRG